MAKVLTLDQIAERKEKAVRFVRDVLGDEDRADEIADETAEEYAERRKFVIANPQNERNRAMPGQTKQELLDQLADLQEENDTLKSQLDAVADIVNAEDEGEDEEDGEDDVIEEDDDQQ